MLLLYLYRVSATITTALQRVVKAIAILSGYLDTPFEKPQYIIV
jgi:hypothetical protein